MYTVLGQMEKPTVAELDECLKDLVKNWKRFGLHLPGIGSTDIDIIKEDTRDDVVEQKIALYNKWLKVYPEASWNDVVTTLEKVDENTIAERLREKYLKKVVTRKEISSMKQSIDLLTTNSHECTLSSIPNKMEEVSVHEDVVTELESLERSFSDLTCKVKRAVKGAEETNVGSIRDVVFNVRQARAFDIDSLKSVKTTDELFEAIHPHYNFLNYHLIIRIALLFEIVANKATQYKEDIVKFMKATKVKYLKGVLSRFHQCRFPQVINDKHRFTKIEIKVENGWGDQPLWLVRKLIEILFPVKDPDELPWYDIVPGSIVMTFIAFRHMTRYLALTCQRKVEFMRSMGITCVLIDGHLVDMGTKFDYKLPEFIHEEMSLPFEDRCLLRATLADDIKAVCIILQFSQVNINVKGNIRISILDQLQMFPPPDEDDNLQKVFTSFHATFSFLMHDIKQVLQYIKPPSGNPDYEFLNTKPLSDMLPRLPKPLSCKVEQYIQSLKHKVKRLSLIEFTEHFLTKYIPTPFPGSIEVIIILHKKWSTCSVWYVEQLGQLIFTPTLFYQLQWYRVNFSKEEVRICLLADEEIMNSLKESVDKNESRASLLGVLSIQIDDTIVVTIDNWDYSFYFNEKIEKAKSMGDDGVSNLLLQIQQSPVDHFHLALNDENHNHRFVPHTDSTPLMIACCNDNSQLVQLLLDHNADPNVRNGRGATALMYSTGNSKVFQMLLDHGAKIENIVTIFNESLIYFASMAGNLKVMNKVLQINAEFIDNKDSIMGNTPLILASTYNYAPVVKALLEAGADPNIQNMEGSTALMEASINGYEEIVKLLIQENADPDILNNNQETAVYLTDNDEIVNRLAKANANLSIYPALLRDTFLSDDDVDDDHEEEGPTEVDAMATEEHSGDEEADSVDEEFYEEFQQVVINASSESDKLRLTLWSAVDEGKVALAKALLEKNTNPNISVKGVTPLMTAITKGYVELTEKLLQAQADPNVQDEEGRTPLMIAYGDEKYEDKSVRLRSHTLIQLLLKAKANPNIQDKKGNTPLMIACSNDDAKLVSMLLKAGADPTIANNEGSTALDFTVEDDIVNILLPALQVSLQD